MIKAALLAVLVVMSTGCATPAPKTAGVTIPPEVMEQCKAEGGCTLYSKEKFEEELEKAFTVGFMAGVDAAAKKRSPL